MTIYVAVEGEVEGIVFPRWISRLNSTLTQVNAVSLLAENTFYVVSGHGYPQYLKIVAAAAQDVRNLGIVDRLVVSVDAESMSVEQKQEQLRSIVGVLPSSVELRLVVANCCFESWALGNRRLCSRPIGDMHSPELAEYRTQYDICVRDPELMPTLCQEQLNRAQFAYRYLSLLVKEKGRIYSKHSPYYVAEHKYLDALERRVAETEQMLTFRDFLAAVS